MSDRPVFLYAAVYDNIADAELDYEAVFDLHPYVLEAAGLEAALRSVAQEAAARGRFGLRLDLHGYGPHALPGRPWTGGPLVITWSDGQRTLTWSPGVQIMWMDGSTHRMCGREGHHH